jgi:hypothetical protein
MINDDGNPNTSNIKYGRALIKDIRFGDENKIFDCFLIDYGIKKSLPATV